MADVVNVACCQIAPSVEEPRSNLDFTRNAIREAAAGGAQLVILPELSLSGYVFKSADATRAAAELSAQALDGWATEAASAGGEVVVVGGFAELGEDGRVYNSCALVDRTGIRTVYRKVHLWDRESLWFHPGTSEAPVIDTSLGRIGLAVCYDLEFPELTRGLALRGAELIAVPANWPRNRVERATPILSLLASSAAYLSKVFVAVCDRCGAERGLAFEGGSVIAGPDGRVLAGGKPGPEPVTVSARCALEQARDKRSGERNDAFADRRPELYPGLLGSTD